MNRTLADVEFSRRLPHELLRTLITSNNSESLWIFSSCLRTHSKWFKSIWVKLINYTIERSNWILGSYDLHHNSQVQSSLFIMIYEELITKWGILFYLYEPKRWRRIFWIAAGSSLQTSGRNPKGVLFSLLNERAKLHCSLQFHCCLHIGPKNF